jgi:hypothetical protein
MPDSKSSNTLSRKTRVARTDIFMSIKPEHINNIAARLKNHEYRGYLLPSSVHHIWFYTSAPASAIHYVARVSGGKVPGQVPEDGGLGNEDFNAGRKVSKYGYEVLELWKLERPITLQLARAKGYLKGPPQKYNWVPQVVLDDYPLSKQNKVFRREKSTTGPPKQKTKISDFMANVDSKSGSSE